MPNLIRVILIFLIASVLPMSTFAVDFDPIEGINSQIKKGTCNSKVEWCPIKAERSNMGFTLHGKYDQPINGLSVHYENLTPICFLWKEFGGASGIWVVLEIRDPTGEQLVFSRRCK